MQMIGKVPGVYTEVRQVLRWISRKEPDLKGLSWM